MKMVFAHDHKLREIDGSFFTTGGLSDDITEKYLNFVDSIDVLCRVIPRQNSDNKLIELKNPNIKIHSVSNGSLIINSKGKKIIETQVKNCDAVVIKLHSFIGNLAIKYAKKYKKPYLIEMIGDPWDAYWNYSLTGKVVAPYMFFKTRKEVRYAPFVLYVTKNYLEQRYPTFGKTIDCSDVQINDTDIQILNKRIIKIKNMDLNHIVLGTLAQVDVKYKGQEDIIRVIPQLKKLGINVKYRLAGSGNTSYLRNLAQKLNVSENVIFDGILEHKDVFKWLDDLDIYIQPSKQEGLPRSLAEAISRACPAFGTQVGGIPELINSEFIFKKGNSNYIIKEINSITKEKLIECAKSNYATSKNYNRERLEKRRLKFYKAFFDYCREKRK